MAYEKHNYQSGDVLMASELNEMDEAIEALDQETTQLKDDLSALIETENLPPSLESDAFYSSNSDTGFYVCNRVITEGTTVQDIKLKANSAKACSIYFIDATTYKVLYIKYIDTIVGWNNLHVDWIAPADCLVGFNGCYIDFRSGTAVTDDDILLNSGAGLYEGSPKTAVVNDTVTVSKTSDGRYAFAVSIVVAESGTVKDLIDDVVKIKDEIYNGYILDNGNLLRYSELDGEVGYFGRWWDYNGHQCTNADGSELFLKTSGASVLTLTLGQINAQTVTPYMAVSIDGGEFTRQQIDNAEILLPDTGEHIVRIMIDGMTEKNQYQSDKWEKRVGVYVISIAVDAGTMKGILPTNKIGVFYGDSLTEGINALGTGANSSVNSACHAFPYYCARALNAVPFFVGYGGTGLTITSSFHPCIDAIDWDAYKILTGKIEPDFIVVNHGINDYGASVTAETFINAYETVIKRLRAKFYSAPIFCVVPFRKYQPYSAEMKTLCQNYPNAYFVSSRGWDGDTSDGTHLSAVGAENNGKKLASEILSILGKGFFI